MVNGCFVEGLADRVDFIPHTVARRFGISGMGRLNATNGIYFLAQFFTWWRRLKTSRPAIAHYAVGSGWNLEKGLLFLKVAHRCGSRALGHLHSGDFLQFWKHLGPARKSRALRELRSLDGLVVLSEAWKQKAVQEIGLSPDRVFVVNNPIERDFEEAALKLSVRRDEPVVLGLGIMEKAKGVFDLLDAMSRLAGKTPVRLILAGPEREPNIYEQINRRIEQLGLEDCVTVTGEVQGADKLELFRRASVFVLPSYFENFPLVILEAAAAGLGIITTPVGATPEFFQHDCSALFVKPGDVDALAASILELLRNESKRGQLARAARAVFVEQLSRARVMDAMYSAYLSVLGSRPAGGKTD